MEHSLVETSAYVLVMQSLSKTPATVLHCIPVTITSAYLRGWIVRYHDNMYLIVSGAL